MSAGKGDTPRPVNGDRFRESYDRIFRPHEIVSMCCNLPVMRNINSGYTCSNCGAPCATTLKPINNQ